MLVVFVSGILWFGHLSCDLLHCPGLVHIHLPSSLWLHCGPPSLMDVSNASARYFAYGFCCSCGVLFLFAFLADGCSHFLVSVSISQMLIFEEVHALLCLA